MHLVQIRLTTSRSHFGLEPQRREERGGSRPGKRVCWDGEGHRVHSAQPAPSSGPWFWERSQWAPRPAPSTAAGSRSQTPKPSWGAEADWGAALVTRKLLDRTPAQYPRPAPPPPTVLTLVCSPPAPAGGGAGLCGSPLPGSLLSSGWSLQNSQDSGPRWGHAPVRGGGAERAPCTCERVHACLCAFLCVPVQARARVCECTRARTGAMLTTTGAAGRGEERARKRPSRGGELTHVLPPLRGAGAPTDPARARAGGTLSAHSGAPTDLPPGSPAPRRGRRFAPPLAALTWAWAGPTCTDGVAAGARLWPPAAGRRDLHESAPSVRACGQRGGGAQHSPDPSSSGPGA